jgi:hypothetical protein
MRQTVRLDNQGSIKGFLLLAVLVGIAYALIMFGGPYYRYNTLRSHTKDMLLIEQPTPERIPDIKQKILAEAGSLKIPLVESNIEISVSPTKVMKVKATWSEVVNLMDYYSKKIDFEMDVEY